MLVRLRYLCNPSSIISALRFSPLPALRGLHVPTCFGDTNIFVVSLPHGPEGNEWYKNDWSLFTPAGFYLLRRGQNLSGLLHTMVYLSLKRILATIAGLSALDVVRSAPLDNVLPGSNTTSGGLVSRATPAPPHFVIYSDRFVSGLTGPPPVSQVKVREYIIRVIAFTV